MLLARVRQSGTLTVQQTISSFQTDGLFRIPNELQYRANLVEQNAGAHLAYHLDRGQLGATYLHTSFDYPLQKTEALRNAFEFRGKHNHLLGCMAIMFGKISIFLVKRHAPKVVVRVLLREC